MGADMIGMSLGRYVIDEAVARGGMGQLYLAHEIDNPAGTVVIKCVRPDPGEHTNRDRVRMFLDEARVATLLDHPNIVKVYEVDYEDGFYYMVMERLLGWDLFDVAKRLASTNQWMPVGILVRLMIDACQGLDAAHRCKTERGEALDLVHRDVSLTNLFLTEDGVLKVLDFGVAKTTIQVAQTRTGEVKGKVNYMSPEQLRNQVVDCRSDIFSLGVVMHELLTGDRLFKRATLVDSMRAVLTEFIPPPVRHRESLNADLVSITMRALHRDPDLRFSSASEVSAALEATRLTVVDRAPIVAMLRELNAGSRGLVQDRGPTVTCSSDALEAWAGSVVAELDPRVTGIEPPKRDTILDEILEVASGLGTDPTIDTTTGTAVDSGVDVGWSPPLKTTVAVLPRRRLAAARVGGWSRSARRLWRASRGRWIAAGLALVAAATLTAVVAADWITGATPVEKVEVDRPPENELTDALPPAKAQQPPAVVEPVEPMPAPAVPVEARTPPPVVDEPAPDASRPRVRGRDADKPARPATKRDKPKARRGRLTLEARPWAEVYLGNKLLGTTPLINKSLPAGEVELRLRNPEAGLERTITVEIHAGETVRTTIDLD